MKKLLTGAFALAVSLQMAGGALLVPSHAANATDINGFWAQNQIQQLINQNVIGGYPDGSFRPYGNITRAEFAAILVKALHLNTSAGNYASFNDVPTYHWAYQAVETARANNLISGYPNGTFQPNAPVSRVEAMAILSKAIPGGVDQGSVQSILSRFSDANSVPAWGQAAVAETIQTGVFANEPQLANMIEPNQNASRGEVAAMTSNLLARLSGNISAPIASNPSNTNYNNSYTNQQTPGTLQGRVLIVPENTEFVATLNTAIDSQTAKVGDQIQMTVDMPLASRDNVIVVPAGTKVTAEISTVDKASRLEDSAKVGLRLKEMVMSNGERLPIQGRIATESGLLEAGSTAGRVGTIAGKTALGAGAGAALGTALGALSGGSVGKGAIYGAAIGGGLGAAAGAAGKGDPVQIPVGQQLKVKLDAPLQMTVNSTTNSGY